MEKMNNIKTIYLGLCALIVLIILALAATLPAEGLAFHAPYETPAQRVQNNPRPVVRSISPESGNFGEAGRTVTITGGGFVPNSVARVDGANRRTTFIDNAHLMIHLNAGDMVGTNGRYINVFNPAPGGGYSSAVFFTIHGYVDPYTVTEQAGYPSDESILYPGTINNGGYPPYQSGQSKDETYGSLAAGAILGSTSFMPSGLIQWVFFAILILLIVIVVRRVFGADRKYHAQPLKHA